MFENGLSDPEVKTAYREETNKKLQDLLMCYLGTNMGYLMVPLAPTVVRLFTDTDRRRDYPEVEKFYPTLNETDFLNDPNFQQMQQDQIYCVIQYMLLIATSIISIVLLRKTIWFQRLMPLVLLLMSTTELPFFPIFPFRIKLLMVIGVFPKIFINLQYDENTLALHLAIGTIEFAWLFWRLNYIFKEFGNFFPEFDLAFYAVCITIIIVQT